MLLTPTLGSKFIPKPLHMLHTYIILVCLSRTQYRLLLTLTKFQIRTAITFASLKSALLASALLVCYRSTACNIALSNYQYPLMFARLLFTLLHNKLLKSFLRSSITRTLQTASTDTITAKLTLLQVKGLIHALLTLYYSSQLPSSLANRNAMLSLSNYSYRRPTLNLSSTRLLTLLPNLTLVSSNTTTCAIISRVFQRQNTNYNSLEEVTLATLCSNTRNVYIAFCILQLRCMCVVATAYCIPLAQQNK